MLKTPSLSRYYQLIPCAWDQPDVFDLNKFSKLVNQSSPRTVTQTPTRKGLTFTEYPLATWVSMTHFHSCNFIRNFTERTQSLRNLGEVKRNPNANLSILPMGTYSFQWKNHLCHLFFSQNNKELYYCVFFQIFLIEA